MDLNFVIFDLKKHLLNRGSSQFRCDAHLTECVILSRNQGNSAWRVRPAVATSRPTIDDVRLLSQSPQQSVGRISHSIRAARRSRPGRRLAAAGTLHAHRSSGGPAPSQCRAVLRSRHNLRRHVYCAECWTRRAFQIVCRASCRILYAIRRRRFSWITAPSWQPI